MTVSYLMVMWSRNGDESPIDNIIGTVLAGFAERSPDEAERFGMVNPNTGASHPSQARINEINLLLKMMSSIFLRLASHVDANERMNHPTSVGQLVEGSSLVFEDMTVKRGGSRISYHEAIQELRADTKQPLTKVVGAYRLKCRFSLEALIFYICTEMTESRYKLGVTIDVLRESSSQVHVEACMEIMTPYHQKDRFRSRSRLRDVMLGALSQSSTSFTMRGPSVLVRQRISRPSEDHPSPSTNMPGFLVENHVLDAVDGATRLELIRYYPCIESWDDEHGFSKMYRAEVKQEYTSGSISPVGAIANLQWNINMIVTETFNRVDSVNATIVIPTDYELLKDLIRQKVSPAIAHLILKNITEKETVVVYAPDRKTDHVVTSRFQKAFLTSHEICGIPCLELSLTNDPTTLASHIMSFDAHGDMVLQMESVFNEVVADPGPIVEEQLRLFLESGDSDGEVAKIDSLVKGMIYAAYIDGASSGVARAHRMRGRTGVNRTPIAFIAVSVFGGARRQLATLRSTYAVLHTEHRHVGSGTSDSMLEAYLYSLSQLLAMVWDIRTFYSRFSTGRDNRKLLKGIQDLAWTSGRAMRDKWITPMRATIVAAYTTMLSLCRLKTITIINPPTRVGSGKRTVVIPVLKDADALATFLGSPALSTTDEMQTVSFQSVTGAYSQGGVSPITYPDMCVRPLSDPTQFPVVGQSSFQTAKEKRTLWEKGMPAVLHPIDVVRIQPYMNRATLTVDGVTVSLLSAQGLDAISHCVLGMREEFDRDVLLSNLDQIQAQFDAPGRSGNMTTWFFVRAQSSDSSFGDAGVAFSKLRVIFDPDGDAGIAPHLDRTWIGGWCIDGAVSSSMACMQMSWGTTREKYISLNRRHATKTVHVNGDARPSIIIDLTGGDGYYDEFVADVVRLANVMGVQSAQIAGDNIIHSASELEFLATKRSPDGTRQVNCSADFHDAVQLRFIISQIQACGGALVESSYNYDAASLFHAESRNTDLDEFSLTVPFVAYTQKDPTEAFQNVKHGLERNRNWDESMLRKHPDAYPILTRPAKYSDAASVYQYSPYAFDSPYLLQMQLSKPCHAINGVDMAVGNFNLERIVYTIISLNSNPTNICSDLTLYKPKGRDVMRAAIASFVIHDRIASTIANTLQYDRTKIATFPGNGHPGHTDFTKLRDVNRPIDSSHNVTKAVDFAIKKVDTTSVADRFPFPVPSTALKSAIKQLKRVSGHDMGLSNIDIYSAAWGKNTTAWRSNMNTWCSVHHIA
jgi:hypothetical protein